VIDHQYDPRRNQYDPVGQDTKKIDHKALLFDFTFLKQLTHPDFIQHYKEKLDSFVQYLQADQHSG